MHRRPFLAALTGLVLLAGCGGDSATGPDSVAGVYTLQTVNGQGLPVTVFQDATGRLEITGGRVSLNGDGSFTDVLDFRVTSGASTLNSSVTILGTYTRTGNNITFSGSDGESYSMALSGRTLTQADEGFTLVYRR